jgi:hypothetical protein
VARRPPVGKSQVYGHRHHLEAAPGGAHHHGALGLEAGLGEAHGRDEPAGVETKAGLNVGEPLPGSEGNGFGG